MNDARDGYGVVPEEKLREALRGFFGHGDFRPGQEQLVKHTLAGRDALGIMPTGAGKSICYQLPALLLPGITLVVSPLISLMKDQVGALVQQGVRAAYLNSSLSAAQYAKALQNAREGLYKIIYVAPERLPTDTFLRFATAADISMVTVDEAHCVSQWGQDFRPSYRQIPAFLDALPRRPVLSAFTATATAKVREDIVELLELRDPCTLVTGFDRPNLEFMVRETRQKDGELLAFLAERREQSGVVYCSTRKAVEQVCELLRANGYPATRYHAGLPDAERRENQEDFVFDRAPLMVATNAFGMGIDKSDVRFVVHYNMPGNIESYYQEAGRAGRDGEPAACLLLYAPKDVETQKFFIENSYRTDDNMEPEQREALRLKDYALLRQMTFYATTTTCLRHFILRYFGEQAGERCGNCSNCSTEFEQRDITEHARVILDCVRDMASRGKLFGKGMVAAVLRGARNERLLSFRLDDLPAYGRLAQLPQQEVAAMIDFLVRQELLAVNDRRHGILECTPRGEQIAEAEARILMQLPKASAATARLRSATGRRAVRDGVDNALFQRLRELRASIAKSSRVPAYVVFSDATLADMCAKQPLTHDDFLEVSGVGNEKARRYAEAFTRAIGEYLQENA